MTAAGYDRLARSREALEEANRLLLPLQRAAARLAPRIAAAQQRQPVSIVKTRETGDRRVRLMVIDLPASKPLLLAVYVSTQRSRPASPAQVSKRIERIVKEVNKIRGKLFNTADIVYIYLSKTRLTRSAYRIARQMGVLVALSASAAASLLRRYLRRRLERLLEKTRGRIWGALKLLAETLKELANSLGEGEEQHEDYAARLLYIHRDEGLQEWY